MKRWNVATAGAMACVLATLGCSRSETAAGDQPAPASAWAEPPRIAQVEATRAGLVVTGRAGPGARVVLRAMDGAAFGAAADADGRFDIRIGAAAGHRLMEPLVQAAGEAGSAPGRLLIVDGGEGPVALLAVGEAGRRFGEASLLDTIDSDGRVALASGRVASDAPVTIRLNQGAARTVQPAADGRWTAMLGPVGAGPQVVSVNDARYDYPGVGAAVVGDLTVERAGAGWRAGWRAPGDAVQWTWLPDAVR